MLDQDEPIRQPAAVRPSTVKPAQSALGFAYVTASSSPCTTFTNMYRNNPSPSPQTRDQEHQASHNEAAAICWMSDGTCEENDRHRPAYAASHSKPQPLDVVSDYG